MALRRIWGPLAAAWGISGVFLLLASAIWRLTPVALEAFEHRLGERHLAFLVVWVPAMLWSEGYRGFHLQFCPRVVARADHLQRHPHFLHALLAPFFCVGYFHATRRRMAASWLLTTAIVILIVVVGRLPQPWRGLVDVGVVLGLAVGLGSLAYFVIRWIGQGDLGVDPELPSASEKKRK